MLPSRISVYLKEDGKTYISMIHSRTLAMQIGGTVGKVMKEAFSAAEKFNSVLNKK